MRDAKVCYNSNICHHVNWSLCAPQLLTFYNTIAFIYHRYSVTSVFITILAVFRKRQLTVATINVKHTPCTGSKIIVSPYSLLICKKHIIIVYPQPIRRHYYPKYTQITLALASYLCSLVVRSLHPRRKFHSCERAYSCRSSVAKRGGGVVTISNI